jgi:hypothetical protein
MHCLQMSEEESFEKSKQIEEHLLNDTNDQSVTLMSTFVPANRHQ